MKTVKVILISLAILIAIPLIAALFIKKDYAVERQITINKPRQEVFDYIKYIRNQDNYSKWAMMDPNMKKDYKGTDGAVGFVSAWDSDNKDVGKGEQEIVKITEGQRVDVKLRFKEPFEAEDDAYMITEDAGQNQTKVRWGFTGSMPYPFNFMSLFFDMDNEVGKDLEVGLANLKKLMEK